MGFSIDAAEALIATTPRDTRSLDVMTWATAYGLARLDDPHMVSYHLPRTTYNEPDCACTITCATQPLTLLADPWGCALFLDQGGDLWHVSAMASTWDWESAGEIDSRHDFYDASRIIEHLLRQAAHVLKASTS